MIKLLEVGTSSLLDVAYDKSELSIDKVVHSRIPEHFNSLYNDKSLSDLRCKYDAVIYSRSILTGTIDEVLRVNYYGVVESINQCIELSDTHIIVGSVCGLLGNTYPTKVPYWASKQLMNEYVTKELPKLYPDKKFAYIPMPAFQSSMTKNSSGFDEYMSLSDANKLILNDIKGSIKD